MSDEKKVYLVEINNPKTGNIFEGDDRKSLQALGNRPAPPTPPPSENSQPSKKNIKK